MTTSGFGPASTTAALIATASFTTRTTDRRSPLALTRTITDRRR
jgi:hypothetical protein